MAFHLFNPCSPCCDGSSGSSGQSGSSGKSGSSGDKSGKSGSSGSSKGSSGSSKGSSGSSKGSSGSSKGSSGSSKGSSGSSGSSGQSGSSGKSGSSGSRRSSGSLNNSGLSSGTNNSGSSGGSGGLKCPCSGIPLTLYVRFANCPTLSSLVLTITFSGGIWQGSASLPGISGTCNLTVIMRCDATTQVITVGYVGGLGFGCSVVNTLVNLCSPFSVTSTHVCDPTNDPNCCAGNPVTLFITES